MRLLSVFAFCAVALADSKPEADLRQRLAASETARAALENSIATPRSQMSTRLKDADASTRAAATGRSEAKATAAVQSDAIAGVRRTTDDIQLQIAEIPLEIACAKKYQTIKGQRSSGRFFKVAHYPKSAKLDSGNSAMKLRGDRSLEK